MRVNCFFFSFLNEKIHSIAATGRKHWLRFQHKIWNGNSSACGNAYLDIMKGSQETVDVNGMDEGF